MKKLLDLAPVWISILLALVIAAPVLLVVDQAYKRGEAHGLTQGAKALESLRLEHEQLRREAADEALSQLQAKQQQVLDAETQLIAAKAALAVQTKPLTKERIVYVSTPTDGAVFITCGWLRDYNTALGASLPAPSACAADPTAQNPTWAATGSRTELQPAGVSLADVLAHARDYGTWALGNTAQLNALLALHKDSD